MAIRTVVRHAKSSWDYSGVDDSDRPLNMRGIRDAFLVGHELVRQNFVPDVIITSHANRAFHTAIILAKQMRFDMKQIEVIPDLYHASSSTVNRFLKNFEHHNHVMLFAHNPGLTDYVNECGIRYINNLPTCGVYSTESNGSELTERMFLTPKMLK